MKSSLRAVTKVTTMAARRGHPRFVLAFAAAVAMASWLAPAAGAAGPPKLVVQPPIQRPGSSATVIGQGFPPSSAVQVQICGNDDLDGSTDCAVGEALEVVATGQGQFEATLVVAIPPKPCPCVAAALDFSLSTTPETPISVLGAPIAAPTPTTLAKLQLVHASVEGNGPWSSWFGAEAERTLVLTVHNPNPVPYINPPLVLSLGGPTDLREDQATAHILGSISADGNRTFRIPLTFPAFSIGDQHVVGVIGSVGLSRRFTVASGVFPWGLLIALLVLLELALFGITKLFRERYRRHHVDEAVASAVGPDGSEADRPSNPIQTELEPAAPTH
jgi:hypothetical protein